MGFTIERHGFATVANLIHSIVGDLKDNGFALKFPTTYPASASDTFTATLEAGINVDPLAATQPWRVHFEVFGSQQARMIVATPLQLPNDGTFALTPRTGAIVNNTAKEPVGIIGSESSIPQTITPTFETRKYRFIDRSKGSRAVTDIQDGMGAPMSYRLSISDHGIALFVWEPGTDSYIADNTNGAVSQLTNTGGNYNAWVVVQRPVDKTTGAILTTGKAPVFCIYKLYDSIFQFVVREQDIPVPTAARLATEDMEDNRASINALPQVAINEADKYVVTFPNRLNTPRYSYTQELDMIGLTSADVISEYTDVVLTVYGEQSTRIYKAMQANLPYNTGLRVLIQTSGIGISENR